VKCYICERTIHNQAEMDHFPKPKRNGGKTTLPICVSCHDAKDRISIGNMDASGTFLAMAGIWSKATIDEKILIARMIDAFSDTILKREK